MKKLISLLLLTVICVFALVSCGGGGNNETTLTGYYTKGDNGYFFTPDGAVAVGADGAKSVTYTVADGSYTVDGVTFTEADLTAASFAAPTAAEEYFTYTEKSGKKFISGLTDLGKSKTVLFAPADAAGIEAGALNGGAAKAFVIGTTTAFNIGNGAFKGTSSLNVYIDGGCTTTMVTCGKDMLTDTTGVTFYIGSAAYGNFKEDYTWANFSSNIKKY